MCSNGITDIDSKHTTNKKITDGPPATIHVAIRPSSQKEATTTETP